MGGGTGEIHCSQCKAAVHNHFVGYCAFCLMDQMIFKRWIFLFSISLKLKFYFIIFMSRKHCYNDNDSKQSHLIIIILSYKMYKMD